MVECVGRIPPDGAGGGVDGGGVGGVSSGGGGEVIGIVAYRDPNVSDRAATGDLPWKGIFMMMIVSGEHFNTAMVIICELLYRDKIR